MPQKYEATARAEYQNFDQEFEARHGDPDFAAFKRALTKGPQMKISDWRFFLENFQCGLPPGRPRLLEGSEFGL